MLQCNSFAAQLWLLLSAISLVAAHAKPAEVDIHYTSYFSVKAPAYSHGAFRSAHGWIKLEKVELQSSLHLLDVELWYLKSHFGYADARANGFFVVDPPSAKFVTVYVVGYGMAKDAQRMNEETKARLEEQFKKEEEGDEDGDEEGEDEGEERE